MEHNNEYVYIYISPISAHVIPKRAFTSAQVADDFYQLARISKAAAA
ncbi:MAG: YcxB family protein [Pyrinomonadaceae bacterium]|nr:YcxB family protein [Pyrinomonadaceae bacterium]